ncbi:HAD hydrolase-like protein [Streptomyces spectabilis]|uniref:Phosphoglycolate phosphatase-like HAD superfamily hydrolase n=1 Tax=Streptomyces spectabilis TaxID=68270 RepID=A0A7W8B521_STRST|nr:HAD hydrolase-like protein [Streptomyces spectabilis]MBB5109340.1 phosphoglycolate phosphatase-like HAD superfamily hydrolase [Streptomyces spectabilis]
MEGALAAGVRVIAVATGRTSAQDLHAAGADMVLTDLSTTKALVDLVTAR